MSFCLSFLFGTMWIKGSYFVDVWIPKASMLSFCISSLLRTMWSNRGETMTFWSSIHLQCFNVGLIHGFLADRKVVKDFRLGRSGWRS